MGRVTAWGRILYVDPIKEEHHQGTDSQGRMYTRVLLASALGYSSLRLPYHLAMFSLMVSKYLSQPDKICFAEIAPEPGYYEDGNFGIRIESKLPAND